MKWLKKKETFTQPENQTVYVFKTSILSEMDVSIVQPQFDTLPSGTRWNFDLEDCDNILKIESSSDITQKVVEILNEHHYECEELK